MQARHAVISHVIVKKLLNAAPCRLGCVVFHNVETTYIPIILRQVCFVLFKINGIFLNFSPRTSKSRFCS